MGGLIGYPGDVCGIRGGKKKMAAPIYLDKRGPFERMMPNVMQMLLANQMRTRQLQEQNQLNLQREGYKTVPDQPGDQFAFSYNKRNYYRPQAPQLPPEQPRVVPIEADGKLLGHAVSFGKSTKFFSAPKKTDPSYNIHFATDDKGNVTRVITDPQSQKTVSKENLGTIGKSGQSGIQVSIEDRTRQQATARNKTWAEGPSFSTDIEKEAMAKMPSKQEWSFLSPATKYQAKRERAEAALQRIYGNKNVKYGVDAENGWGFMIRNGKTTTFIPWESPVVQFFPEQEMNAEGGQVLRGTLPK